MKISYDILEQLGVQAKFEPGETNGASLKEVAQLSIALSLKRIADALESTIDHRYDQPAVRTRTDS